MFVPDLGELAYAIGGVEALSKETALDGDGTDLPINCPPAVCNQLTSEMACKKEVVNKMILDPNTKKYIWEEKQAVTARKKKGIKVGGESSIGRK